MAWNFLDILAANIILMGSYASEFSKEKISELRKIKFYTNRRSYKFTACEIVTWNFFLYDILKVPERKRNQRFVKV
jgi:hypothetical protein